METDAELKSRLEGGDVRAAASMVVARFADEVYGFCRAVLRDAGMAEERSHEVFAHAFGALRSLRPDAALRPWMLRIARNALPLTIEPEPTAEVDESPAAIDAILQRSDLEVLLGSLSALERSLVVLRFGHEASPEELGAVFDLDEASVRRRLHQAVGKMREEIESSLDEPTVQLAAHREEDEFESEPTIQLPARAPARANRPPRRNVRPPRLAWNAPPSLRVRLASSISEL